LPAHLKRYEHATPETIHEQFIDTTGSIDVEDDAVTVTLTRRTYTPVQPRAGFCRTGRAHSLVGRTPPPVPLQVTCSDGKRLRLITGARIEVKYFIPRASPQDLQIDPERSVCFDRSPIPGRKPEPVLERRCANQRVIDGTPGDTSPGKTGEELLGRCSAEEAR
jgi:hypothetical protein